MNTETSDSLTARLAALVNTHGVALALLLGGVVLVAGIGSTGLWEPWEMDRADLARTLASPPEAVAAFARDPAGAGGQRVAGPGEQALMQAAQDEDVLVKLPEAGTPNALRAALDLARTRNVAAIVIDTRLLIADPARDDLWKQAGKLSAEAQRYAAGASLVLVRDPRMPPAPEIVTRLSTERWRDVWDSAAPVFALDAVFDAAGVDEAARALAATSPDPLIVVEPGDVGGLAAALAEGAGAVATRVAFKDNGRSIALPPLETWLRAVGYRIFGASEWTTRLPGAVLAFIALWVLLATVRTVWSTRVAFFTGFVLISTPLFFAQARIIAGEPGLVLALTLVGCGLLLSTLVERKPTPAAATALVSPGEIAAGDSAHAVLRPRVSARLVWAYLGAGLLTAVFTKGAYALALAGLVALALPLVSSASRRLVDWAPAALFIVAAALTELLARGAADGTLFAGLGFESALFSDGPSTYSRTFDMVIRQLGFGLAPWSPIVVVAAGFLLFTALEKKDRVGLIVVAWFFLPIAMLMASLKLGNQFVFAGTAAAAIAVALLIERLVRGESGPKYFAAFALVTMFYIMRRELKASPEPLVGFLAYDPPFAREGNLRFPESVEFAWVFKQSMILAAVACLIHFGAFARFAVRAARWLRQTRPFLITTGILLFVGSLLGLAVIGRLHGIGMSSRFAGSIQPAQKALAAKLTANDPLLIVGLATLVLMLGVIVLRWVFPAAGRSLAASVGRLTGSRAARAAWLLAAGLWALSLVVAFARVIVPDDGYWGERLASNTAVLALSAAGLIALLVWALERFEPAAHADQTTPAPPARWWIAPLAAFGGVLALVLTSQLVRDSGLASPLVTLLVVGGFAAAAVAVVPRIARKVELLVFAVGTVLALVVMSYVLPLVDRAGLVTEVVLPDVANPHTYGARTLLRSTWFIGPVLAVFALLINRALPRLVSALSRDGGVPARLAAWTDRAAILAERGRVLAGVLAAVALIGVVVHLTRLEPAIAVNVSQKHILDTWHQVAGEGAPIYKHGAFATQGRKDANFYTAEMPEIRDRQAALKVLLGREDQVLDVETATGGQTLLFPGWSSENDKDGDGRRDAPAIRGFATQVGDSVLTDATQRWTSQALIGKRLADAAGRTWLIVDNDQTSVRVAPEERLSFSLNPRSRAFYVIDDARLVPNATAELLERRALLLPADQLSDLNYAFRILHPENHHLPVLDGSSYRVLLTTSWLADGEPQENRLALATYTEDTFAALRDPRLNRLWGNFDDTIMIVGYATDKPSVSTGEMLNLTVYYKTLKLVKKSLKIFIHMDKTGGGARIAGDHWPLNPTRHSEDNKNCGGCYRTDHWLVGDIVKDSYDIEIPEGNPGEYTIWIGLYQPGPDTRLTAKSWDQKRVKHDGQNRLAIGTIQVK